jgi:hypothetical protein
VINFRTLAIAAAISTSVIFVMPVSSQAMPQAATVKIDAAGNGNLVQVHYRKRYCRYHRYGRCYRHARYRYRYRYRYYDPYYEPYYGYYQPYYGYYPYYRRPYWGGSGIGIFFRF